MKILIQNDLFFHRVLKVSKTNEKQRRSPNFCVGPNAKRVFGLACIEKIRLLIEVFCLFYKLILKRRFLNLILGLSKAKEKQRSSLASCLRSTSKKLV